MNHQSNNHATPPPSPEPSAICSAYAPQLPLLQTGELAPEQAAATSAHLAGCAWCRARLASYDALYAALRQRFDPDVVAAGVRVPSAREIAEYSAASTGGAGSRSSGAPRLRLEDADRRSPGARGRGTRWRLPIRFDAVAAILLVTLLGALLAARSYGLWGGPPPLNPQEQAYVAILRADYLPLLDAIGADSRQCVAAFDKTLEADKPQAMADCRPVEQTALTDSHILLTHLQATTTSLRWQSANSQLKTWAQAQFNFYTARIQAIDMHDVTRFTTLGDQGAGPPDSCPAIKQIDAALPADGQLPGNAVGYCGG